MTDIIQLPNNNTALLLSSDELTNKQVKELRRAARKVGIVGQHLKDLGLDNIRSDEETEDPDSPEGKAITEANAARALSILTQITDEEDDSLDLFQRTCAAVRTIEWSLDLPLPKTPEDVDNLPRAIYAALTTEAAKLDLNETFDMESGINDPKADTSSSDASEASLEVTP